MQDNEFYSYRSHHSFFKENSITKTTSYQGYVVSRTIHIKDDSFVDKLLSMTLHIKGNSCQAHFISSYQGKLISRALHIKTDSLWTNSIVKNTLIFKRNLSQRPLHIKDNFYQAHFISTDVFGPKCCYCTVYAATAYHICHILLTAILYKGCGYHIN